VLPKHNPAIHSSAEDPTAKVVEFHRQNKACPWKHGHVKAGGEFIEFDMKDVTMMMLAAFGLEATARHRPVLLLQAVDGHLAPHQAPWSL
jgi:hypothetical protein